MDEWCHRLDTLFLQGHIFDEPGSERYQGHKLETATYTALTNLKELPWLACKGKILSLWNDNAKAEIMEAYSSAQLVVAMCIRRLHSDFPDTLVSDLNVFDLRPWMQAIKKRPDDSDSYPEFCRQAKRKLFRLCRALKNGEDRSFQDSAWQQMLGFAEHLAWKHESDLASRKLMDNRELRSLLNDKEVTHSVLGCFAAELLEVFHVYNPFPGGTGTTERALGCVSRQLESHCGPLNPATVESLTLLAFTPLGEDSWATWPSAQGSIVDGVKVRSLL